MKKIILRAIDLVRTYGLAKVITNFGDYVKWKYQKRQEVNFDKKYNIETMTDNKSFFDTALSQNTKYAVPYEPVQHDVFKEMMDNLSLDLSDFTFVDLGSGKGRALVFASDYGFEKIIGVEFCKELHSIAENNIHNYLLKTKRKNNFSLECKDAVDYNLPETNLAIFLYNPFFGDVMNSVMEKINYFVKNNNYNLIILYRNPECADLFDSNEAIQRDFMTKSYCIYYKIMSDLNK